MKDWLEYLVQPLLYLVNEEGHPVVWRRHVFCFESTEMYEHFTADGRRTNPGLAEQVLRGASLRTPADRDEWKWVLKAALLAGCQVNVIRRPRHGGECCHVDAFEAVLPERV